MGTLESKFSRNDIDTLIDSMSDWEALGNQDYHLLNMVKNAPMPPEDHEAFEMMQNIKDHFLKREREIKESRETRQERATFLKAKLMLVRTDMGIEQLFEMATDPIVVSPEAKEESPSNKAREPARGKTLEEAIGSASSVVDVQKALERAEYFIRDMGVWSYYEKFLEGEKTSE